VSTTSAAPLGTMSDAIKPVELEVTWKRVAVMVWAYFWRIWVFAVPCGLIVGYTLGTIFRLVRLPQGYLQIYTSIVDAMYALTCAGFILFYVLKVRYKRSGFRIVLVEWIEGG